jgi:hypothetical protein
MASTECDRTAVIKTSTPISLSPGKTSEKTYNKQTGQVTRIQVFNSIQIQTKLLSFRDYLQWTVFFHSPVFSHVRFSGGEKFSSINKSSLNLIFLSDILPFCHQPVTINRPAINAKLGIYSKNRWQ